MKRSRQVLLMGPWTHGGWGVSYAGDVDFGPDAPLDYNDLRLAWFDHFLKGLPHRGGGLVAGAPVRDGRGRGRGPSAPTYEGRLRHGGVWRDAPDYPLPGTALTPYYLHARRRRSRPSRPARAPPRRATPSTRATRCRPSAAASPPPTR